MSKVRGVMFEKWNAAGVGEDRQVEVRRDRRRSAARRAPRMTSNTISPQAAAPLVEPVDGAVPRVAGMVVDVDDEMRDRGPRRRCGRGRSHSITIAASNSPSTRGRRSRCRPRRETPRTAPARGSRLTRRTCLPSARSAKAMASCDPMESPSGLACELMQKRGAAQRSRRGSRIRCASQSSSVSASVGRRTRRHAGVGCRGSPGSAVRPGPAARPIRRRGTRSPARAAAPARRRRAAG